VLLLLQTYKQLVITLFETTGVTALICGGWSKLQAYSTFLTVKDSYLKLWRRR